MIRTRAKARFRTGIESQFQWVEGPILCTGKGQDQNTVHNGQSQGQPRGHAQGKAWKTLISIRVR